MYGENKTAMKKNEIVLNDWLGQLTQKRLMTKTPDSCKYLLTLIKAVQNQKKASTGVPANLLKLTFGTKVILALNKDIRIRIV